MDAARRLQGYRQKGLAKLLVDRLVLLLEPVRRRALAARPARFASRTQKRLRYRRVQHKCHVRRRIANNHGLHLLEEIEIDAAEVPILDGSAAPFVRGILSRGVQRQGGTITAIEILQPVSVDMGAARATLKPSKRMRMRFDIEFPDAAIGRQSREMDLCNGHFVRELCDSRTFCRQSDVDLMQANGLALGGVPGENAVVVDGDAVVSPGGLRHDDEPVRHKMLDALGDLALAGAPILGEYEGLRAGHMLTNRLLRKLFATPGAWRLVDCTPEQAAALPGVDLHPEDLTAVA